MQGKENFLLNAFHQGHLADAFNHQSQHHGVHVGIVAPRALRLRHNGGKLLESCIPVGLSIDAFRCGQGYFKAQHLINRYPGKVHQLRRIVDHRRIQRKTTIFPETHDG